MSVPNTFATSTTAIPLSNLDENFAYYDSAFNVASGVMSLTNPLIVPAPAPAVITSGVTLTNADIQTQIVLTTGLGGYPVTLPLGTTLETLVPWGGVNVGYDFYVININTGTITMTANTGVTIVGRATVLTSVSGQFRIRRTAANTFTVYRIN